MVLVRYVDFSLVVFFIVFIYFALPPAGAQNFIYPTDNTKYEGYKCLTKNGVNGICRQANDCGESDRNFSREDICSYVENGPIYCCPVNEDISKKTIITNQTPSSDRLVLATGFNLEKSQQSDNSTQDSTQKITSEKAEGGGNSTSLRPILELCNSYRLSTALVTFAVTGGKLSLAEQHPHMTAIGWTSGDGKVDWKCGGSIISGKFVLTAAHCSSSGGIQPDVARSGDLNLLVVENNTTPQDYNITDIFNHPNYRDSEMYHDIALMKISPDFRGNFVKKPACLWTAEDMPVSELLALGYGTTAFSGPQANQLYEASIKVLTNEECKKLITASPDIPRGLIDSQMCAQDPDRVKDTCQGDSGGPLQFREYGNTQIVAITSFGQFCAGPTPGVYTRVSAYLDWIESILTKYDPISDFTKQLLTLNFNANFPKFR